MVYTMQRNITPDLHYPDKTDDINTLIIRISKLLKDMSNLTADNMGLVRRRSLQVRPGNSSASVLFDKYKKDLA